MRIDYKDKTVRVFAAALLSLMLICSQAHARDVEYRDSEVRVSVSPGEPTEIKFPGKVSGGYKRGQSTLSIERRDDSLILFAADSLTTNGEAIIVKLEDGRSYSLRIARATADSPRDSTLRIKDERGALGVEEEEEPAYREKNFEYAPPSQISGLMREMVLAAEFGKAKIQGYRENSTYQGQPVLNDGTMIATIDRIFIGPNLWGYVLTAQNMLDINQRINPASFRLDGTRAISMTNWELAPRSMNIEQQIASRDRTKVYIITRAKKSQ